MAPSRSLKAYAGAINPTKSPHTAIYISSTTLAAPSRQQPSAPLSLPVNVYLTPQHQQRSLCMLCKKCCPAPCRGKCLLHVHAMCK